MLPDAKEVGWWEMSMELCKSSERLSDRGDKNPISHCRLTMVIPLDKSRAWQRSSWEGLMYVPLSLWVYIKIVTGASEFSAKAGDLGEYLAAKRQ